MTLTTISKHTSSCRCPFEITGHLPVCSLVPALPILFWTIGEGPGKLVSWDLLLFGFQLGIATWKTLGERLKEERKEKPRHFYSSSLLG